MLVVLAVAGGSYLWLHGVVGGSHPKDAAISAALAESPGDGALIGSPEAMDILVFGSDSRWVAEGEQGRSDTIMLVHADPKQNYLSILSLPRDLRVEVPGHGVQKLNAAYAFGGPALTIRTVKRLTGVDIKYYLEIDFNAFRDITNELGGVYIDVDRRYYNDDPTWELIKISPGYQLLDGEKALDYVRFRHDLNYDFGRMQRQQRFLDAVREQALGWNLPLKLPGLVSSLFDNVTTTLGTNDILRLAYWGIKLPADRIRHITVVGDIRTVDGVSYVIPAEGAVAEAVQQLLSPPDKTATTQSTAHGSVSRSEASSTTATTARASAETSLGPASVGGIPNSDLWKQMASAAPFTLMAPTYLPPGYQYVDRQPTNGGTYSIQVGDKTEPAIKMVYRLTREGEVTDQYMGIMETTWLDAPAASAGVEVKRDGITYTFVGTPQRTERVWWKRDGVLYWVSNTLSYYLSKEELLEVAQSMVPVSH